MHWFARLFPRPVFAGDSEKTRIAAVSSDLMGVIIIVMTVNLTAITVVGYYTSLFNITIAWTALGLVFMCRYLLHRGRVRGVTLGASLTLVLTGLSTSYVAGFVGAVSASAALVGIAFCALTLGPRMGAWLVALTAAGFGGITLAVMRGHTALAPPIHPLNQWVSLVTFCVILLAAAALVRRHLFDAVDRAYRVQLALENERESRRMALEMANDELEARVAERTRELALALKELEAFSYSVSHDLRGPLLSINGHATLLLKQEQQALSDRGRERIASISRNTVRMGEMIEDILRYCRVGFPELKAVSLDMDRMAEEVGAELHTQWPQVRLGIAPLGHAHADPVMLRQVWENLLGNAFKYSSRVAAPRVDVSVERRAGEQVFCISDNGVGFDEKYAGKLFGMFQRLETAEPFEGHGIGLAIVKRLVERHGGQVWATSISGQGATFCFTLPDQGANRLSSTPSAHRAGP